MLMMMILYLKAFNADNPVFPSPWTPSDPTIRINITENIPPGQVSHSNNDEDDSDSNTLYCQPIFKLAAKDPLTGQPILNYQKLEQGRALENLIQVNHHDDNNNDDDDDYDESNDNDDA